MPMNCQLLCTLRFMLICRLLNVVECLRFLIAERFLLTSYDYPKSQLSSSDESYSVDHLFGTPPCYLFSMSRFEQKDFAALFYNQKTIEKCYNIMLKSPDHCLMSV